MKKTGNLIKGISVCNPVDVEHDYLMFTVDYAIEHGFDHMQVIGPIHNPLKGNIDGMTEYRKYADFNTTKDMDFVRKTRDYVNEACEKAKKHGIKMYVWHHELDIPTGFGEKYPEILNKYNDVEVTHPIIKDFLENKIIDFFFDYPDMDGIILTLHETKVPLLKLKNQKLDKIGRVKYVTEILYNTCKSLGKELIVRPFASIEEDYVMMMNAYEEISSNLIVMDKWTQFDWSLCLPNNAFYNKIKNNPLFVETDIFGEFFGKGRLPLMLKKHITEKFDYCRKFSPIGYVSRIDRAGKDPFGDVNQVNIDIMNACLNESNVDNAIFEFFKNKYPNASNEVMELMEHTEDVLRKIIYLQGYYYSELSLFPSLNHSKNHFYFEMMRSDYCISSNEWFIPIAWKRGDIDSVIAEKASAKDTASKLYNKLINLKDKIEQNEYQKLYVKFLNLKFVAEIWYELTLVYIDYVKYFETNEQNFKNEFYAHLDNLSTLRRDGEAQLGKSFYCLNGDSMGGDISFDYITDFINEIRQSFETEYPLYHELKNDTSLTDYIVCGGAMEGHKLQKEVNFSDTIFKDSMLCRIPGNKKGMEWSTISAHGWFSYEIRVKPNFENTIKILAGSSTDKLKMQITLGNDTHLIDDTVQTTKEITLNYKETNGNDFVRIRFDRLSGDTPCIFTIKSF